MSSVQSKFSPEDKMSMYENMVDDLTSCDDNSHFMLDGKSDISLKLTKSCQKKSSCAATYLIWGSQRGCESEKIASVNSRFVGNLEFSH